MHRRSCQRICTMWLIRSRHPYLQHKSQNAETVNQSCSMPRTDGAASTQPYQTLAANGCPSSPVQQLHVSVVLVHSTALGGNKHPLSRNRISEATGCRNLLSVVLIPGSNVLRVYIALIHESIFSSEKPPPVLLVVRYA